MGGIFGALSLDGSAIDSAGLQRMAEQLRHRAPDGVGLYVGDVVALGHCAFHTTPESRNEQQPLTNESGSLRLILDGRIDNREDLLAAIQARGIRARDDTDAELVLRAYEL